MMDKYLVNVGCLIRLQEEQAKHLETVFIISKCRYAGYIGIQLGSLQIPNDENSSKGNVLQPLAALFLQIEQSKKIKASQ